MELLFWKIRKEICKTEKSYKHNSKTIFDRNHDKNTCTETFQSIETL